MMDLKHNHNAIVHCLKASYSDNSADLVACGGDCSVQVLHVTDSSVTSIASFQVGRVTALAWSSKTVSPSLSDDWFIEDAVSISYYTVVLICTLFRLTAATADFGLHLLTKSATESETVFPFGGGLSGHHGKITGMAFSGGSDQDSCRYVATVSDDKMLMVWDLNPSIHILSPSAGRSKSSSERPQPTAYAIAFPHPLTSVNSHPKTSKEFLVSDTHGSIFLTDWRSDPEEHKEGSRHSNVIELVEPKALSDAMAGISFFSGITSSASWRKDNTDIIGAAYGSKFSIWDLSKLQGGKPLVTGTSFPDGSNQFRWSPTFPEYFAISTTSPVKGALIHVYNTTHINAQPTSFSLAPRPLQVRDFDFMAASGIPRIAAAVGQEVFIFPIGLES